MFSAIRTTIITLFTMLTKFIKAGDAVADTTLEEAEHWRDYRRTTRAKQIEEL